MMVNARGRSDDWDIIDRGADADMPFHRRTLRQDVPGGWLYKVETVWPGGEPTDCVVFVPDPWWDK